MARPQQEILLTIDTGDDYTDIIASAGLWAVLYNDKPINARRRLWILKGETYKYLKMVYPNPAHAHLLADKLNTKFDTKLFAVKQIL